jgi:hypothetical protein
MSRTAPSRLVVSGLTELAAGALSGWVYTIARTQPELSGRLGIKSAARARANGTSTSRCSEPPPSHLASRRRTRRPSPPRRARERSQ